MAPRQGQTATQGAEGTPFQGVEEVVEEGGVDPASLVQRAFHQFLATAAANAAGKTLAAGFPRREGEEMGEEFRQGKVRGDGDDAGVTQQKAMVGKGLEVQGQLGHLAGGDQAAQGAADLVGLDRIAGAAAQVVKDLAQGRAHLDLIDAGAAKTAVEGDQFGPGAGGQAQGGIGTAAGGQDGGQVGQGLDVAEQGGLAIEAVAGGVGGTGTDLGPQAFDGVEEGGLLAANIGPGAPDDVKAQGPPGAGLSPGQGQRLEVGDGPLDSRDGLGILGPDIEDTGLGADDAGRRQHATQDGMGTLLQEPFVGKGPGIALIRVAHHKLPGPGGLPGRLELEVQGKAGAAPTA